MCSVSNGSKNHGAHISIFLNKPKRYSYILQSNCVNSNLGATWYLVKSLIKLYVASIYWMGVKST